jgi:hypothetical protein
MDSNDSIDTQESGVTTFQYHLNMNHPTEI